MITERKVSASYQNSAINAIKFYFEKVLGGRRTLYFVERPRKEKALPVVCSEEEIRQLLTSVENIKHRAILNTIYSSGLRISELVNLRIKDIDSERMQIRVEQAALLPTFLKMERISDIYRACWAREFKDYGRIYPRRDQRFWPDYKSAG